MKAEIKETNFLTRRQCVLCGDTTEKEAVLTKITEGGEGWLCDSCVEAGRDGAIKRALRYWKGRLEQAQENLNDLAQMRDGQLSCELPTIEALKNARERHEEEWLHGRAT